MPSAYLNKANVCNYKGYFDMLSKMLSKMWGSLAKWVTRPAGLVGAQHVDQNFVGANGSVASAALRYRGAGGPPGAERAGG